MGISYSQYGLCCDFCGKSEPKYNVRKIACPYGYCQAWACCIECKAKKLHLLSSCTNEKKTHKEYCKPLSLEWQKRENEKAILLESGKYLRIAALGHGDNVKVIFKNIGSKEIACWMHEKTYRSIPLGHNASIDDFKKIGQVWPAINTKLEDPEGHIG